MGQGHFLCLQEEEREERKERKRLISSLVNRLSFVSTGRKGKTYAGRPTTIALAICDTHSTLTL